MAYGTRAMIHEDLDQFPEAEAEYRKAVSLYEGLAAQFPTVREYQTGAAVAQNNLAAFLEVNGGQLDEAEGSTVASSGSGKAWRPVTHLTRSTGPGWPSAWTTCPGSWQRLAVTWRRRRRYRRTVELRTALTRDFPDTPHHFAKLGQAHRGLAKLATLRGDLGEARRLQEQAIASSRAALALAPQNANLLEDAQGACTELIETLIRSGEHEGAAKTVAEFVALSPGSGPESLRAGLVPARCVPLAEADTHLAGSRRRTWPRPTPTGRLSCSASP